MDSLIAGVRLLHITAGTIALVVAPIAMLTVKGGRIHRRWGKVYFWMMAVVALTAVVLAIWRPVVFLALLAVFSFYSAFSGYRALYRKRPAQGQAATGLDWSAAIVTFTASGALAILGILRPNAAWERVGVVPVIFGAFGMVLAGVDLVKFFRPPADRNAWWFEHMGGMLGSYIAAVSAFSVVNFALLPTAVRWLWPTAIGTPLIALWITYYKVRFRRSASPPVQVATKVLACFAVLVPLAGCAAIAIGSAPAKPVQASTTALAAQAVRVFWESFYDARYDDIPRVQMLLTAAYLEAPGDPQLALLLAHTHLWRIAERARLQSVPPEITDHMILADRYFEEARRLAPDDERVAGWLGAAKLALGNIHRDERLKREGYFMLKRAADAYPEFNGFSFAYPLITQPHASARFAEAVAAMWSNTDLCTGRRYDRARPDFGWPAFSALRTDTGRTRVCWNTALVPHNVEGFLLHFGDTLLKNGQPEAAEAAYRLIRQVPDYATWRFKAALDERLAHLNEWMTRLRDDDPKNDPPVMFTSAIACTACHAR